MLILRRLLGKKSCLNKNENSNSLIIMKIRIVNLDFYMNAPIPTLDVIYSDFRGCSVNHVPIIRIFGSTETGHKICLHVHGVFPYIYIPYDSQIPGEGFLYQIASGIDKAINLSLGQTSSNVQHIYKVSLVSGIPLYGYHARKHQFLKLYFYNPLIVKKACTLLQNGSILGKIYQPNEAHIPYILQFMIDYNLHGMSFIHLRDLKYRVDPNYPNEYPEDAVLPITISKMSVCRVEADTQADCILNREEITPGKLTKNPGIKAIWDDEKQRKRNNYESSQIEHCLTQNRINISQTATHIAYKNVLEEKLKRSHKTEGALSADISVYPAETPSTADIMNASTIENHTSLSQNTDNSSLDGTIISDLTMTNFDQSMLNEDAQKLYDLLQDLRQDNIEKDSILSQVQRDVESEDEGDLSVPLDAIQTPRKIEESTDETTDEFWNDSYFDALTHIPQLDGSCDGATRRKRKHTKKLEIPDNSESETTKGKSDNVQLLEKGSIEKCGRKNRKHQNKRKWEKINRLRLNTSSLFNSSEPNNNEPSPNYLGSNSTTLSNLLNGIREAKTPKNQNQSPRKQKSLIEFCTEPPGLRNQYLKKHNTDKKTTFLITNMSSTVTSGNCSFGSSKMDVSNSYVLDDRRNSLASIILEPSLGDNETERSGKIDDLRATENNIEEQNLKSPSLGQLHQAPERSIKKNKILSRNYCKRRNLYTRTSKNNQKLKSCNYLELPEERNKNTFCSNKDNIEQSNQTSFTLNEELQLKLSKDSDNIHGGDQKMSKKLKQFKNKELLGIEREFSNKYNSVTSHIEQSSKLSEYIVEEVKHREQGSIKDISKFSETSIPFLSVSETLNTKLKLKLFNSVNQQKQTSQKHLESNENGASEKFTKHSHLDVNNIDYLSSKTDSKFSKRLKRSQNEYYLRISKNDNDEASMINNNSKKKRNKKSFTYKKQGNNIKSFKSIENYVEILSSTSNSHLISYIQNVKQCTESPKCVNRKISTDRALQEFPNASESYSNMNATIESNSTLSKTLVLQAIVQESRHSCSKDIKLCESNTASKKTSNSSRNRKLQRNSKKKPEAKEDIQELHSPVVPKMCVQLEENNPEACSIICKNSRIQDFNKISTSTLEATKITNRKRKKQKAEQKPVNVSINNTEKVFEESYLGVDNEIKSPELSKKTENDVNSFEKIMNILPKNHPGQKKKSRKSKKKRKKKNVELRTVTQGILEREEEESTSAVEIGEKTREISLATNWIPENFENSCDMHVSKELAKISKVTEDTMRAGQKNEFLDMPIINDTFSCENINDEKCINKSNFEIEPSKVIHLKNLDSNCTIASIPNCNNNLNDYVIKTEDSKFQLDRSECPNDFDTALEVSGQQFNSKAYGNANNGNMSKEGDNIIEQTITKDTFFIQGKKQNSETTNASNLPCPKVISLRYATRNTKYDLRPRISNIKAINQVTIVKPKRKIKKLFRSRGTQTLVKSNGDNSKSSESNFKRMKPVCNVIIKKKGRNYNYEISVVHRHWNFGPHPKPKFRIVPAERPYTFQIKKKINHQYPNTTWTCDKDISSNCLEICNKKRQNDNSVVVLANKLLKNDEKFNEDCIEKGNPVNIITSRVLKETQAATREIPETLDVSDSINNNTCLKGPNSRQMETAESVSKLSKDDIYGNMDVINTLISETRNLTSSNACDLVPDSNKILSFDDLDFTDIEYIEYDPGRSTNKDRIVQEDRKEYNAKINNYRYEMENDFKDVCGKLEKSFDNLFEDVKLINSPGSTTNKLILDNIKENNRKQQREILVRHRVQRSNKKIRFCETCMVRSYSFDHVYSDIIVQLKTNGNGNSYKGKSNDVKFQEYDRKNEDNCEIMKSATLNELFTDDNYENNNVMDRLVWETRSLTPSNAYNFVPHLNKISNCDDLEFANRDCTEYDPGRSTDKDTVVREYRKENSVNINNYRNEMKNDYKDVCEKLERSLHNLFEDVTFMSNTGSTSNKLILDCIKENSRKEQGGILVRHRTRRSEKKIRFCGTCKVRSYSFDHAHSDIIVELKSNEKGKLYKERSTDVKFPGYDRQYKKGNCEIINSGTVDYNKQGCQENKSLSKMTHISKSNEKKDFNHRIGNGTKTSIKLNSSEYTLNFKKKLCSNIHKVLDICPGQLKNFDLKKNTSTTINVSDLSKLLSTRSLNNSKFQVHANSRTFLRETKNKQMCPQNKVILSEEQPCLNKSEVVSDKSRDNSSTCGNRSKDPYPPCVRSGFQNLHQAVNCYKDIDERAFEYNMIRQSCFERSNDVILRKKELPYSGGTFHKTEFQESNKRLTNILLLLQNKCITQVHSSNSVAASNMDKQDIDARRSNTKSNRTFKKQKHIEGEKYSPSTQQFAVDQFRYTDGPNDSSSEDENDPRPALKKKCGQFRKAFSQSSKYSPLKVHYGSPTKNFQPTQNSLNLKNPLYRPSISLTNEHSNNGSSERSDFQQKYKRKLNFSEISSPNRTILEENLVCRYKIDEKLSEKIETIVTPPCKEVQSSQNYEYLISNSCHSSENMDESNKFPSISDYSPSHEEVNALSENASDAVNIVNVDKIVSKQNSAENLDSQTLNDCGQLNVNQVPFQEININSKKENKHSTSITVSQTSTGSESISDDLFSPGHLHASFSSVFSLSGTTNTEVDNLNKDPAQLYDVENKFVPQAGTSKFNKTLIQSSSESNSSTKTLIQLSLESNETNVSSSAENRFDAKSTTSSDISNLNAITPYQKENQCKLFEKTSSDQNETSHIDKLSSNDNCNESNLSGITPYQKELSNTPSVHEQKLPLTSYLTICESFLQNAPTKGEPCIIVPKYNPPSRSLIKSTCSEYNIPEVHHQQPFYSDINDVTGAMEVGVRILKIPSNNIVDMPEFESNYAGLTRYRMLALQEMYPNEKITNKEMNNYKLSFCKEMEWNITTVKLPPSRDEVELWLKDRIAKKKKTVKATEKKKIFIPCSPGGDNDESDDSLTISPCTPLDNTLTNIKAMDCDNKSYKSSIEDKNSNTSPIIQKSEVLKRHRTKLMENAISNLSKESNDLSNESDKTINAFENISKLNMTKNKKNDSYQITGVTLDRTNNFAMSCENLQNAKALCEYLHLTVICMELIVETRSDHKPNPDHDTIKGIVYKIFNDVPEDHSSKRTTTGCLVVNCILTSSAKVKFSILDGISVNDNNVKVTDSEEDLLYQFAALVTECDPDILIGYEIEMLSWGYLIERGYILNLNLVSLLSRVPLAAKKKNEDNADLTIPGRIILDFWRLLRHEVALQSYTFENIVYHVLHQRVPCYSFRNLTYWWNHPSALYRGKVLKYYIFRVESVLKIIDQLDLIGRTSELAKLFGIQFFEVLSRGSQFRVESMMLRLGKPLNYIPVSPSVQQRARMRAPESLPLIMEPESKFYADPVIVLDFQSLYPSMIIAYNYCFSTCLGRIEHLGGDAPFEFGATQLKVSRKRVKSLHRRDLINISPIGVAYVKKSVREGILPRMLQEILDTRLMVKKSLKQNSGNKTLGKILDARQLGLKLIANVTYGYTAANFSGRMPCIELGDSVVSKGRETLQRAINLVEKTSRWRAKVVYGDTDSLFVLVAGRSREDAFKIGTEIAEAVTNDNPSPVKLKLEKVFHPCILQTKKRYVGYMYESPEQSEPEYCAKGIETVRRDGCPAVSKMLEKCLKILFDTANVSLIRQYVTRQFSKILSGRISIQDLTFAKEYRGSANYRPGACVPALELARKWMAIDKRSEPRRGERVPYVIINGPPGLPLIRLVRSPREVLADPSLRLNALYYITKVIIPPINRCFLLIGVDANNWFNDMPRKQFQYLHTSSPVKGKKSTISQYFSTKTCAVCRQQSQEGLCETCLEKPQETSVILHEKVGTIEKKYFETKMICESCCGTFDRISCISLDCPVYYRRVQTERDIQQAPFIRQLISILPDLSF